MTNREAAEYLDKRVMNIAPYGEWKEVVEMAISALEKQIPKKVRVTTSTKRCSVCGRQLSGIGNIHPERNYCQKCGQAIDWEGE